jgi:hypothetical protein
MIGVDPHKGSHTAVAVDVDEKTLGQIRVRASTAQVENLRSWAAPWTERVWAIEGATGLVVSSRSRCSPLVKRSSTSSRSPLATCV